MIDSTRNEAHSAVHSYPARKRGIAARLQHLAFLAAVMSAFLSTPGHARAEGLAGSWSGGGWVSFATGSRERARCRARYSARSASSYALNATCATASGSVTQDANVRRVGANSYAGSFHNSQYNVSGRIHVTVRGSRMSVTISSDSGSASLSLSR
jgi:hypothetical protein